MTARSRSKFVVFSHPFELKGVDRILPPGDYRVVTDEVLIEELSFPVYRRISTMIFLPGQGRQASSLEMMTIDPRDLEAAQDRDAQDRDAQDRDQCNESTTGGECEQASDKTIDLDQPRGMLAQMSRISVGCWGWWGRWLSACSMEEDMAKGQLRSNREKKKPKADKNESKTSKPASPWVSAQFQPRATRPSTGKNSP